MEGMREIFVDFCFFVSTIYPVPKFCLVTKAIRPRRQTTTTNIAFVAQPSPMHAVIWQQRR
jgi:hypothetical protein